MTEEFVTTSILAWLVSKEWRIVCFDFPQSGTGRMLHPDGESSKNADSIIPDIVAIKDGVCLFFENKNRFYKKDYEKCHQLIHANRYSEAIADLLTDDDVSQIYYGIGLPTLKHSAVAQRASKLVHFVLGVNEDGSCSLLANHTLHSFFC